MEETFLKRIEKVREFIEKKKIDSIFTKNPSHIFYLTSFLDIEGYLLIDKKNLYLFTSPLYFYESLDSLGYNKNLKNIIIKE